jgi:transcription termination/antitermination protein NusG
MQNPARRDESRPYESNLHMNQTERRWYAVYTRSRHEKSVASKLEEKNIEVFLPIRTVLRRWKDRKKEISLPLFSSYVFVRLPLSERLKVLQTPGVVLILSEGSQPVPIPEDQITSIKKLVASGLKFDPYPYLKEGMQVNVVRGPLQGVTGILIEKRKQHMLVLSVDLIQQSAVLQVEISDTDVAGM